MITRRNLLLSGVSLLALTHGAQAHLLMLRGGDATGSAPTSLTNLVVTETSGVDQMNVPITFGLPLAPGTLSSSQRIQVYAADGVTPIATQEDNRASDLTPSVRFTAVTIILPSLAANATVFLPIKILSGAPSTGTDIAISDIIATGYDYTVQAIDPTGTWTASAATALNSGNSEWVNLTTATVLGTWRSGGGYCTEYIVYAPLMSGSTPHANLRAVFHIAAFKAQSGPVSGSNPILAIRTDRVNENGVVQASSPVDDWYGLTDTSGTGNSVTWGNSTPSANLTLSATGFGTVTCTADSSLFNQNSVGNVIAAGSGMATITDYVGTTVVKVNIYHAFSSASLAGGSYTVYGVNHANGATNYQRLWWNGLAIPSITANVGTQWNGTSQTGGPGVYFISTELIPNFQFAASTVDNTVSNLINGSRQQGANPSAYWSSGIGGGYGGDYTLDLEQTGEVPSIGIFPQWEAQALIRWDQYAETVIFGNAQKARFMPFFYRDENTGLTPALDNGNSYVPDPAWVGTNASLVKTPSGYIACWSSSGDGTSTIPANASHMGEPYYISYLLTGDFLWAEAQVFHAFGSMWLANNPTYSGSGLNRLGWQTQIRGGAWFWRTVAHTALIIPDRSPAVLGYTKAKAQEWLENHYTATNSGTPGVGPYPGALISYINNTGSGKYFAEDGPRWTIFLTSYAQWMVGYMVFVSGHLRECGMLSANGILMQGWLAVGVIGACNDSTEVNPKYMVPAYHLLAYLPDSTPQTTWSGLYQAAANGNAFVSGNARQLNGTASISGSGASTLITMPTGNFTAGTSFYAGGLVQDTYYLSVVNTPAIDGPGTDYAVGDTVTLAIIGFPNTPTVMRQAVATVTSVGPGGAVTGISISDPGLYARSWLNSNGAASTPGSPDAPNGNGVVVWAATGTPTVARGGGGYTNGDILTLAGATGTAATFTAIVSGGVVIGVTLKSGGIMSVLPNNPASVTGGTGTGCTLNVSYSGATATQSATSGSGSGLTLSGISIQYGQGYITSISGDTLTVDVTTSATHAGLTLPGYPFANTSLAATQYFVPWSAPTDPVGWETTNYFNSPTNDYIQIAQADYEYLSQFGISGASEALATALSWTGGSMNIADQKWQIAARA